MFLNKGELVMKPVIAIECGYSEPAFGVLLAKIFLKIKCCSYFNFI